MSNRHLKLIARIAENLPDMSDDVIDGWNQNPKALQNALATALCPPAPESKPERHPLLKRIVTITVPAVQRFVCDDEVLKEANVLWTGDNFDCLFKGKVEENVPEQKLAVSRLERASLDAPILTELGDKAEVSLTYMFDLLKKQSKGEDGVLLTNGYANIFYVRGIDGNLWAVDARWSSGNRYWDVGAYSVENPDGCYGGSQIFSRDS